MRYREIINESIKMNEEEQPVDDARYDPAQDDYDRADLGDTRKPKLTLRMVNRLKKIRATKKLELAKKDQLLGVMYAVKPDADSV